MSDKLQDEDTRFMVRTTKRKRALFRFAAQALHIDTSDFFDTAMKGAVLNALHGIESLGVEAHMFDAVDARKELNKIWSTRLSGGSFSADALEG